jgi:hypothetical protein
MRQQPDFPMDDNALLADHASLSQLAHDDPEALEALRRKMVERCIAEAPVRLQARLRGLQFRIDGIRRLSRTPLGATVKIHEMMWASFLEMNDQLQGFVRLNGAQFAGPTLLEEVDRVRPLAEVIAFRPHHPCPCPVPLEEVAEVPL